MVSVTGSVTWISHSSSDIDAHGSQATNVMNSTPAATGWKEPQKRRDGWPSAGTKMPLPFQAEVKSRIHRFTDRCGKTTEALKQQRMRWSIASGVSSPAGLFSRPDSLRVKRKGILGLLAAY